MLPTASPTAAKVSRAASLSTVLVGLLFGAGGFWLLSMACQLALAQRDIHAHAERATGTIVDFRQRDSRNRGSSRHTTLYAPIFTFTDDTGVARRATSRVNHANTPGYRVGATVPILYLRDRPDEAELDTFYASWGDALIAGGFGALALLVGGLFVGVGIRRVLRPGPPQEPPRDPAILSGP